MALHRPHPHRRTTHLTLSDAGWRPVWIHADYYFAMREPEGSGVITYTEGDVDRGHQRRL